MPAAINIRTPFEINNDSGNNEIVIIHNSITFILMVIKTAIDGSEFFSPSLANILEQAKQNAVNPAKISGATIRKPFQRPCM